jgi:hypothetical protein
MGMLDGYILSGNTNLMDKLVASLKLSPAYGGQNNTMLSRIIIPVIQMPTGGKDIQDLYNHGNSPGAGAAWEYPTGVTPLPIVPSNENWQILGICWESAAITNLASRVGFLFTSGYRLMSSPITPTQTFSWYPTSEFIVPPSTTIQVYCPTDSAATLIDFNILYVRTNP